LDKKKNLSLLLICYTHKQWLGGGTSKQGILVLTTTSTIKGAVVWDNKFILLRLSKIKGDNRTAKTDDR
jgi:hypothetical protein